jgi:hypothetical protein
MGCSEEEVEANSDVESESEFDEESELDVDENGEDIEEKKQEG